LARHMNLSRLIKEHIVYLDQEIEKIRKQIDDLVKRNPQLKQKKDLLDSIPGIGKATIPHLLAECTILINLTMFESGGFYRLAPKDDLRIIY